MVRLVGVCGGVFVWVWLGRCGEGFVGVWGVVVIGWYVVMWLVWVVMFGVLMGMGGFGLVVVGGCNVVFGIEDYYFGLGGMMMVIDFGLFGCLCGILLMDVDFFN